MHALQRWLNLRKFFGGLKSPKKGAKSLSSASFFQLDSAQDSDLAPFLGDLSPSEKLSEIKPPLGKVQNPSCTTCAFRSFSYNNLYHLKTNCSCIQGPLSYYIGDKQILFPFLDLKNECTPPISYHVNHSIQIRQ